MSALDTLLAGGVRDAAHAPWPRVDVSAATWREAALALARGDVSLSGLWADDARVHMALLDESANALAVLSLPCVDGAFPSVAAHHPPALRLERALCDLYGFAAQGAPDARPWLDHGVWPLRAPMGAAEPVADATAGSYPFLPVEGDSLHQIPVGPVHAGVIEPGHFRFTAYGETVVRLEQRLGYVHRGVDRLLRGADFTRAMALTQRVSGDSVVAYAIACAQAIEAATQTPAPARARRLRALMLEMERLANHFGDIGAVCNDAAFALMLAHCGVLRERVLRAADAAFGHRLMRDVVMPGGVARDLDADGAAAIGALLAEVRSAFPPLVALYDSVASLQDRTVGTGVVSAALARQYAAGGFVGRASGRAFDARRLAGAAPYDALGVETPLRAEGDVNARLWIRIREVEASVGLIERLLAQRPQGSLRADIAATAPGSAGRQGMALVEGFRGDVLCWLRLDADGRIARCFLRDPSWFQWPLLEVAIEGNIVADFPLCNKSFNCSYSGHDL